MTSADHGHDHDDHAPIPEAQQVNEFEVLEVAIRELSIEHGLFSAEDHRRFTEWAHSIGPSGGSRLVAKAWVDPAFKARLLADGNEACKEVGIDWSDPTRYGHAERRLVRWPREVLAEFGLHFPPEVEVRVHDSNQKSRFMVMPMRPEGTDGWSEEQLAAIVTRDTMIGVALPQVGWTASEAPSGSPAGVQ